MKWFIDLPTRSKFFLGFGVVIALLIVVTVVAGKGISAVQRSQQAIFTSEFANAVDALSVKSDVDDMRVALLMMMSAPTRAEKEAQHKVVREHSEGLQKVMDRLLERNRDEPWIRKKLDELNEIRLAFRDTRDNQLIPLIYAGRNDQARKLGFGIQAQRYEKMRSIIVEIEKESAREAEGHMRESERNARDSIRFFVIIGMAAVLISLFIAVFSNTIIGRPLNDLSAAAERVTQGDLQVSVPSSDRRDEVGVLARTFAIMVERLQKETRDITEAVNVLATSSNEIAATTAQLAAGTQQTAVAVTETTTTVEEVKQTANAASQKARYVADLASNASQVSQKGARLVNETIDGVNNIREQMEYIAETIVKLSEHNQAIGEIITAVDDFAEQSNLLAVNASIEAAKAGEHGKGFGVVAQEIKSLAEQSRQATRQVRTILNDIQKASSAAVMATEKGSKAVDATVRQSSGTGEAIGELSKSISEAAQSVIQIAALHQQQLVGMDQVASAMINIKQASAQNAASTRQVEITVKNLQELGFKLKKMVEHYRV